MDRSEQWVDPVSGPVDVLAVLRRACTVLNDEGHLTPGDDLCKATRAVAELIEAAREMMRQDAVQRATFNTNPFMADAADKLSAALGKVGAK